jgi:hypothetical protein
MNSLEALLSDTRKASSPRGPDRANKQEEVLGIGNAKGIQNTTCLARCEVIRRFSANLRDFLESECLFYFLFNSPRVIVAENPVPIPWQALIYHQIESYFRFDDY